MLSQDLKAGDYYEDANGVRQISVVDRITGYQADDFKNLVSPYEWLVVVKVRFADGGIEPRAFEYNAEVPYIRPEKS